MSTVHLITFATYKKLVDENHLPSISLIHGASQAELNPATKRYLLTAGSVPLGPRHVQPVLANGDNAGLLMIYGLRETGDELRDRRKEARDMSADFHYAEYDIDVGEMYPGIIDRSIIRDFKFANTRRLTSALQSEILARFHDFIEEDAEATGEHETHLRRISQEKSRLEQIAQVPELWGRLIESDSDFSHLHVIVIPYLDPNYPGRIRQVALVRPRAVILNTVQKTDGDLIELPRGFGMAPKKRAFSP